MRRNPPSHEIVGDEAVEQRAEDVLLVCRQRSAEAEDRVNADRSCRQNRRDQRQPVGRCRHLTIGQSGMVECGRLAHPITNGADGGAFRDAIEAHDKRIEMLALDYGKTFATRG